MRQAPDLVALARRRLAIIQTAEKTLAGDYDRPVVSLSHSLGDEPVRQIPRPIVSPVSQTSETGETIPRDCAPRLLMMLWRQGVTVDTAQDGALRLVPHPGRPCLPAVLLAACGRYKAPLAAWVGADASKGVLVLEPPTASPQPPLCPACATRRWWRADAAGPWECWRCEPPAIAGVEELR